LICDLMFAMKAGVYQCPLVQVDRGATVRARHESGRIPGR
jgi:hypothetical protein